jgi:hypothetical protein
LRNLLPEILALSASSPFHESVNTGLHSARTQIFTRFFPRCGVPDAFTSWQQYEEYVRFLYETGSVTEHTQLWWSVRPHLAFPTVEVRIADGQPDLAEAQALAAFVTTLAARIARANDEGEPLTDQPHRLIEENMWRAIRWGLSGNFLDLQRGDVLPTRARLERLFEWIAPVADETTRTIRVRFEVANQPQRLKPREYVDVQLAIASPPTLAIPVSAVTTVDKVRGVFVQRETGYAFVPIEVGREGGGWVEVRKGLAEGAQVVIDGVFDLKNVLLKEHIGSGEGG